MTSIYCPDCERPCDPDSSNCPACGRRLAPPLSDQPPTQSTKDVLYTLFYAVVLVIWLLAMLWMLGCDKPLEVIQSAAVALMAWLFLLRRRSAV